MRGYFQLGILARKHGFKGQIVLKLDTDHPENYSQLESFLVETPTGGIPFFITAIKPLHSDEWVVTLEGVDNENDASALTGSPVWLPETLLPSLGEAQFYFHEIVGFSVQNEGVTAPVVVLDVLDRPGQPLLKLSMGEERKEVYIPCVDEFIVKVDRENRVLHLDAPSELFYL